MFKNNKNLFLILVLIILGSIFYFNRVQIKEYFVREEKIELPEEIKFEEIQEREDIIDEHLIVEEDNVDVEVGETQNFASIQTEEINPAPNSQFGDGINLAVPFTIQSPDQKWDEPYKEGCEEASLLMVQAFLNDNDITVSSALKDIGEMVDWQMDNFNGHFDLPVNMTSQMANDFLELKSNIIYLNSIEDIKEIVKSGYPVILPTAGRELGNPNFTGEGPLYHMLVAKGFIQDGSIITNDPGTRKGENYIYNQDVFWNAIADWDRELKKPDQTNKIGLILKN